MEESKEKVREKKLPLPVKLIVGACAGVFGTTCIFPIDMIKTRLQATSGTYHGPADCVRKIVATEGGVRALYRGLLPNLVGVTPEKAIKLAVNEYIRDLFEAPDGSIQVYQEVLSGAGAGMCQVIATNPMEMAKIRMQLQSMLPEAERLSAVGIVRSLGLKGMYQGSVATLLRDVPFSIIFFPLYAHVKDIFADKNGHAGIEAQLMSGTLAGAFASGAVTPADVIKTRLQLKGGLEKYKNFVSAGKIIYKEEGLAALFKGMLPRMAVVGPLFGLTLMAFEQQKMYMIRNNML